MFSPEGYSNNPFTAREVPEITFDSLLLLMTTVDGVSKSNL